MLKLSIDVHFRSILKDKVSIVFLIKLIILIIYKYIKAYPRLLIATSG